MKYSTLFRVIALFFSNELLFLPFFSSLVYMQTTAQYIMYLCRIYGVN